MGFKIPNSARKKLKDKLNFIYGEEKTAKFYARLEDFIVEFAEKHPELRNQNQNSDRLTEKDSVVIC